MKSGVKKGLDRKDTWNWWYSFAEAVVYVCLITGTDLQQLDEAEEYSLVCHQVCRWWCYARTNMIGKRLLIFRVLNTV